MGHLLKAGVVPGILEHLGVKRVPDRRSTAHTATPTTTTICTCEGTVQPGEQHTFQGASVRLVQRRSHQSFSSDTSAILTKESVEK